MLRMRRIGFVLRVSRAMIMYYVEISVNSTVRQILPEEVTGDTSSAGIAGDADFPGRIIPPFPLALSTATINIFSFSNRGRPGYHLIGDQFPQVQQVQKRSARAIH